jgi:hypothetical protein
MYFFVCMGFVNLNELKTFLRLIAFSQISTRG